jgi:hypothetical protein
MRAALVALLVSIPALARAYPQFQLSTGAQRCNQCHYAPAGGGLINGYGREESSDTISTFGTSGGLLHGLVQPPSWLAVGGDLRLAGAVVNEKAVTGVDDAVFPMQAELYVRLAVGGFSLYLNGGFWGKRRDVLQADTSPLISREHYVMWREGETGWYARAGRFFAPFGLRLVEHTAYVRRFLGFNLLEEPYTLSGGRVEDDWELHVSAWVPDFWRDPVGQRSSGAAAFYERHAGTFLGWGGQAKLDVGDESTRATFGAIGKLYFEGPRIQLLAECDLVFQHFKGLDADRWQYAGYLGAAWFPHKGFLVQLMTETYDEDLHIKGVARESLDASLGWFPIAHVEVSVWGRVQFIGTSSDDGTPSQSVLLQVHYYL